MSVRFACEGAEVFEVLRLEGVEVLGEPTRFDVELIVDRALLEPQALVGKGCVVGLESELGQRAIHGVVRSITCVASADPNGARRYRVAMSSALARLSLRRDSRVFQHLSGPAIAATLLEEGAGGPPKEELSEPHPALRYITQYEETSLSFLRRICEREGFWYRFDAGDERAEVVMGDSVGTAPDVPLDEPILVADEAGLGAERFRAWGFELVQERRPGKVATAGYDFRNPALAIVGDVLDGEPADQATRLFCIAPDATSPDDAERAATVALQAARAGGERVRFRTSAFPISPGRRFELEVPADMQGVQPEASQFCVRVEHRFEEGNYECQVESTPTRLPFRLAQRTPKPKVSGVQTAIVTGPPGEEIYADADGCVRIRFHWDRFGPTDGESSLPVRVVHPNLAGSMLLPRIGWEVWVAFENGDPDRPFVIGRAYNGKRGPPAALPANKTKTMLSTSASPGAGTTNSISFEDGAGKQGLHFNAGKGLTKSVGNNASTQTVADEKFIVDGSMILSVGGNQKESIHSVRVVDTPVQTLSIGGNHSLKTPKAVASKVGTEVVSCAMLMEQVGSPGGGLEALGKAAAMAVGGEVAGPLFAVGKTAYDAHEAYKKGGAKAAAGAAAKGVAGMIPVVGDAVDVVESGKHGPFADDPKELEKKKPKEGDEENAQVGGASAASSGGDAQGGGGNRVFDISGATSEVIGGAYAVATGGESKWTTLGASSIAVGGPHATAAGKVSWTTGGASLHTTGAFAVTAAATIVREARVAQTTAATLAMNAGSGIELNGKGSINLTCGVLNVAGKLVLDAKGTKVTIDGSGLTIEGASVSFDGPVMCKQSDRS